MINKHKALQDWVSTFLTDRFLHFESAEGLPESRIISPEQGNYTLYTDILGFKYKSYTFIFIGYEYIDEGTSEINTDNMYVFDEFTEWVEKQEEDKNYPDFGENCSEYTVYPLQNMAKLASVTKDGLGKYMLACRIEYKEE